jgi:hypothetical protein
MINLQTDIIIGLLLFTEISPLGKVTLSHGQEVGFL